MILNEEKKKQKHLHAVWLFCHNGIVLLVKPQKGENNKLKAQFK